jgi:hypothetical protein
MTLTPQDTELIRIAQLRILNTVPGRALSERLVAQLISSELGQKVELDQIRGEPEYLQDKRMVEPAHKDISPELRAYRITAAGRDYLAQALGT